MAHVTVNPGTATQGGYTKLTFRVPNESDKASTSGLRVQLPKDQPLAVVEVKPHPGWSFKVVEQTLTTPVQSDDGPVTQVVSEVDWTADSPSAAIAPTEFDEFDVSVGPLPDASSMVFKVVQIYSDGSVVRWIEPTTGSAEPEHPAPVLTLVPATTSSSSSSSNGRATIALVLSAVALLVAAGAVVVGLVGRRRQQSG